MKAKGLIVKNFPHHWTNWSNSTYKNCPFNQEEADFYNKLIIDKRPMFMKYLYPTYKQKFSEHYNKYNYLCYRRFGIHIEELIKLENKTEEQKSIVDNYYKFNPLLETDCPMNNICRYMEKMIKEIKINIKKASPDYIVDILYNKNITFSKTQLKEMERIYNIYRKNNVKSNNIDLHKSSNEDVINLEPIKHIDALDFDYISDDIQRLANIAVYINYVLYPKSSKNFCWDLFGDGIILNIYDNSNKEFYIPIIDENGDMEYMGKRYKNERVKIECQ